MYSLARFAVRRRWLVIIASIAFVVVAQGLAGSLGGNDYEDTFDLPHTETDKVMGLMDRAGLDAQNGLSGQVVFHAQHGALEQHPTEITAALGKLCAPESKVVGVASPWGSFTCDNGHPTPGAPQPKLLSDDGTTAIANVDWSTEKFDPKLFEDAASSLKPLRTDNLQVAFTGDAFQALGQTESGFPPVLIGFLAALVVLAIVFRTIGATALPLASAAAALMSGLGLIGVLTHVMAVSNVTPQLTQLMVIGVGVDYALFIVSRHRRNLRRGMPVPESIAATINTSGRAVLFAGTTVCVAMLGLIALGVSFFYGMAIGVAIAVAMTMLASVTLLPALLGFLGLKVLPRRQRHAVQAGRFEVNDSVGIWAKWSDLVARRRWVTGAAGAVVMLVLAIPFFSMRMGHADQGNDRAGTTTREGYDLIAQGFGPGYNSNLSLIVHGPHPLQAAQQAGAALRGTDDVAANSVVVPSEALTPTIAMVSFKSDTAPQDSRTTELVDHLRSNVLPQVEQRTSDQIYVYGETAVFVDFADVLSSKMPLFIAAVVGVSFLLLLIAFRSLVIPLTAAVMNLLAAGASFGIIVALFQWGWATDLLGVGSGPIEAWAPVMFFAILFGLSMYHSGALLERFPVGIGGASGWVPGSWTRRHTLPLPSVTAPETIQSSKRSASAATFSTFSEVGNTPSGRLSDSTQAWGTLRRPAFRGSSSTAARRRRDMRSTSLARMSAASAWSATSSPRSRATSRFRSLIPGNGSHTDRAAPSSSTTRLGTTLPASHRYSATSVIRPARSSSVGPSTRLATVDVELT